MTKNTIYQSIDWERETLVRKAISDMVGTLSACGFVDSIRPREDTFRHRFTQLNSCQAPFTAFTPAKVRFLYELAFAANASGLIGLGTFAGIGFLPAVAGAVDRQLHVGLTHQTRATSYGVDLDGRATQIATVNSQTMELENQVEFTTQDAFAFVSKFNDSVDFVFIDIDEVGSGKHRYSDLFEAVAPVVRPGGVVVADDAFVPKFTTDLDRLRDRIGNHPDFSPPVSIPIDASGLCLTFRLQ